MRKSKRLKPIPKFSSRKEEREFWETHDTSEYFDEKRLVKLAPHMKGVNLVHVYVAPDGSRYIMIPEDLKKRKAQMAGADKPFFLAAN